MPRQRTRSACSRFAIPRTNYRRNYFVPGRAGVQAAIRLRSVVRQGSAEVLGPVREGDQQGPGDDQEQDARRSSNSKRSTTRPSPPGRPCSTPSGACSAATRRTTASARGGTPFLEPRFAYNYMMPTDDFNFDQKKPGFEVHQGPHRQGDEADGVEGHGHDSGRVPARQFRQDHLPRLRRRLLRRQQGRQVGRSADQAGRIALEDRDRQWPLADGSRTRAADDVRPVQHPLHRQRPALDPDRESAARLAQPRRPDLLLRRRHGGPAAPGAVGERDV